MLRERCGGAYSVSLPFYFSFSFFFPFQVVTSFLVCVERPLQIDFTQFDLRGRQKKEFI